MLVSVASIAVILWLKDTCACFVCQKFAMEHRAAIKFYFNWGENAMEVYLDLKNVYSDDWLNHAQVYQWFAHFHGRESLEDDAHPGH
jgi:hypothetical protein